LKQGEAKEAKEEGERGSISVSQLPSSNSEVTMMLSLNLPSIRSLEFNDEFQWRVHEEGTSFNVFKGKVRQVWENALFLCVCFVFFSFLLFDILPFVVTFLCYFHFD